MVQLEGWIQTILRFLGRRHIQEESACTTFRVQHKAHVCSDFGLCDFQFCSELEVLQLYSAALKPVT